MKKFGAKFLKFMSHFQGHKLVLMSMSINNLLAAVPVYDIDWEEGESRVDGNKIPSVHGSRSQLHTEELEPLAVPHKASYFKEEKMLCSIS